MRIVGLGTQDSLGLAEDFVATYGTTSFQMLWDPTFESWARLGVRGQPAFMILDRDGRAVEGWYGSAEPDEVLAKIADL